MGVATVTAIVGAGISAYTAIKSASDKKKAQAQLNNYERQELINPYKDIKLSTYGTDIQRQDANRDVATLTEASRNAGIRGVFGAVPKIGALSNKVNENIGQQLEQQDINRQQAIARGEMQLMGVKENRDNQNISAISSQWNAANQDYQRNLWGVASGLASAGRSIAQWMDENNNTDSGGEDSAILS